MSMDHARTSCAKWHAGWRLTVRPSSTSSNPAIEAGDANPKTRSNWREWPSKLGSGPPYQVDHGQWKVNYKPKEVVPIAEWFKAQGRFKHLAKNDKEDILAWHQEEVETNWAELLAKEEASKAKAEAEKAEAPVAGT